MDIAVIVWHNIPSIFFFFHIFYSSYHRDTLCYFLFVLSPWHTLLFLFHPITVTHKCYFCFILSPWHTSVIFVELWMKGDILSVNIKSCCLMPSWRHAWIIFMLYLWFWLHYWNFACIICVYVYLFMCSYLLYCARLLICAFIWFICALDLTSC
jgi:hypothetical protein